MSNCTFVRENLWDLFHVVSSTRTSHPRFFDKLYCGSEPIGQNFTLSFFLLSSSSFFSTFFSFFFSSFLLHHVLSFIEPQVLSLNSLPQFLTRIFTSSGSLQSSQCKFPSPPPFELLSLNFCFSSSCSFAQDGDPHCIGGVQTVWLSRR